MYLDNTSRSKSITMQATESGVELVGGWGGRGRRLSPEQPEQPAQSVQVTPRPYVQDAFRHLTPVEVDLATLKSKFDMRLSDAAKSLGISITSFKQVCRKLGVARWPRRVRPRSGAQQPGSNSDSESELIESPRPPIPRDGGSGSSVAGGSRKRPAESDINTRSLRVGESGLKESLAACESFLLPADPSIQGTWSDGRVSVSTKTAMHQTTQRWTLPHSLSLGQAARSTAMPFHSTWPSSFPGLTTEERCMHFAPGTPTGGTAKEGLHQVLRPSPEVLPWCHRGLHDLSHQSMGSILGHDSFDTRSATRSTLDMPVQCAQSPHVFGLSRSNFPGYGVQNLAQQSAESPPQRRAGLGGLSAEIESTELQLASLMDLQEYIAFPSLESLMKDRDSAK